MPKGNKNYQPRTQLPTIRRELEARIAKLAKENDELVLLLDRLHADNAEWYKRGFQAAIKLMRGTLPTLELSDYAIGLIAEGLEFPFAATSRLMAQEIREWRSNLVPKDGG